MDPIISILLYSKYSKQCMIITETINKSGVNFLNITKLKLICIDNQFIRNKIKKSKKILITSVPCMLLIFSDGTVEKHDGENLFKWVHNTIKKLTPEPEPEPEPETEPETEPEPEPRTKPKTKPKPKTQSQQNYTSIDDLVSEEESIEIGEKRISPELNRKPPRGIKNTNDTDKKTVSTLSAELSKQRENDIDEKKRPGMPNF